MCHSNNGSVFNSSSDRTNVLDYSIQPLFFCVCFLSVVPGPLPMLEVHFPSCSFLGFTDELFDMKEDNSVVPL